MPGDLETLFPALAQTRFELTSPRDAKYNCVAWAAADDSRWWWPDEPPFSYWPAGVVREESVGSFVRAFETLGYERVDSGAHEDNFERVAIFACNDGTPTHMARELADGSWTSKLGSLEDIIHLEVQAVSGSEYGRVVQFLRRRRSALA